MASALGILGSMMQGGGEGVRENARRSIENKEKQAQEQRETDTYNARLSEQRDYEEGEYARKRSNQLEDDEAKRKHDIELAKIRNKGNKSSLRSNTLLTNRVKSFELAGNKYLEAIDEISSDPMMTPEQKVAATAPMFARLDELVENNPEMGELSPLYGSFYSSAKSFVRQFENPNPTADPTATASNVDTGFVIPVKRNDSSTAGTTSSEQPAGGLLHRMKMNPGQSDRTTDLEVLRQSGNVRPF